MSIENYYNLQSLVGNAKVMGVIKANAYGHGALPVSRILSESGIYGFCVALSSEAEELIRSGIQKPILHLGRIHKHNLELYNSGQVHCTINSFDDLKILEQYYSGNKPIKTHLKIDLISIFASFKSLKFSLFYFLVLDKDICKGV